MPAHYIIFPSTGWDGTDPLWVEIMEDSNHPNALGQITDAVPFLTVLNNPEPQTNGLPKLVIGYRIPKNTGVKTGEIYEGLLDNNISQIIALIDRPSYYIKDNYLVTIVNDNYVYNLKKLSKKEFAIFLVNLTISE